MPNVKVPGVQTYHSRESWQDPAKPVTGPPSEWIRITTNVAHYTADDDLIDGDPGEHASQLPQYMRDMQSSYLRSRGYSLGYLFAVDWLGGVWEIRGFDIRSAANKGNPRKTGVVNFNGYSFPILFLVDGADGLTEEARYSAQMLYREAERRANRPLGRPKPHSDLDYTSCCGNGIRMNIAWGHLDPIDPVGVVIPPPQPPITLPPTSGADMKYIEPSSRGFDSRSSSLKAGAFTHDIDLKNFSGVPITSEAVTVTLTAVSPQGGGYATVWSGAGPMPNTSDLNWSGNDGAVANTTVTRVSGGKFKVYLSGPAHLLVDIKGYQ